MLIIVGSCCFQSSCDHTCGSICFVNTLFVRLLLLLLLLLLLSSGFVCLLVNTCNCRFGLWFFWCSRVGFNLFGAVCSAVMHGVVQVVVIVNVTVIMVIVTIQVAVIVIVIDSVVVACLFFVQAFCPPVQGLS